MQIVLTLKDANTVRAFSEILSEILFLCIYLLLVNKRYCSAYKAKTEALRSPLKD